jgi:di/tricarboxylate transporter
VANIIGQLVLKMAGRKETTMIIVIMTTAGVMSAVMNNVAVAAMMMPIVMDVARHTGTPPSRLLMPLAYGSLLGGLTTQIGTPPNILVSVALRDAGLKPFGFFDFTPVGLAVMGAGILFMTFVGRHATPSSGSGCGKGNFLRKKKRLAKTIRLARTSLSSAHS